jgi:hypothetical protein
MSGIVSGIPRSEYRAYGAPPQCDLGHRVADLMGLGKQAIDGWILAHCP